MKLKLLSICLFGFLTSVGMADVKANNKVVTIQVSGMKFIPDKVEISEGDTVRWENVDLVPHTATSKEKTFDSGLIAADGSWQFSFAKKGTFNYVCTFHPTMTASVIVK